MIDFSKAALAIAMIRSCVRLLAVLAFFVILDGCGQGKRPFLIAQVCLRNADDLSAFAREMQSIARSQASRLIDRSAESQKQLETIGHPFEGARTKPIVNLGVELRDGVGLMVGNLGLPGYQVAVGFSEGSNAPAAHQFAQTVVKKLEEHWHVEIVPDPGKSGALPMRNCT